MTSFPGNRMPRIATNSLSALDLGSHSLGRALAIPARDGASNHEQSQRNKHDRRWRLKDRAGQLLTVLGAKHGSTCRERQGRDGKRPHHDERQKGNTRLLWCRHDVLSRYNKCGE